MKKKRATMNDVAKRAGVTQPTVSYVINSTANISQEVKDRVNLAIEELNYNPNYFARVLKTNKTNIVGIVIPDISNEYYSRLVNLAQKRLEEMDYLVIIHATNYDEKIEAKIIKQLVTYNPEGIIVMYQLGNPKCWDILAASGRATVVLEGGNVCGDIPCINTDNYYGGYTATMHLINNGLKKIAYVNQNSNIKALLDRCAGYEAAMKESGLSSENLVYQTSIPGDKWKEGVAVGKKLVEADVEGIVVSSDIIAVGVIKTLLLARKRIPQDISVIGYDNNPLAQLFVPSLTTLAQPVEDMCDLAIRMLFDDEYKDELEKQRILLKPNLIVRESTL